MDKEDIDIKPTESKEKIQLSDGSSISVGKDAVNLENGKSDPKEIIKEMQKHPDEDIFKEVSDEQSKSASE